MVRRNKRCKRMLDLANVQNNTVIKEDTSVPKYRRVYQKVKAKSENQPSSSARNKIQILQNITICPPATNAIVPETSGCLDNLEVTPKRRKIFHLDKEEGSPKIYVSPSTGVTFQTLQNAEMKLTPTSKLHQAEVNKLSPYYGQICHKDLNTSSTASRCSSVSDLSCAQYLTCPLNADQVAEVLSTPIDISLKSETTSVESISKPKLDNLTVIDYKQNSVGSSEEKLIIDNNTLAHIIPSDKDISASQGTQIEPTSSTAKLTVSSTFILNDDSKEMYDGVTTKPTTVCPLNEEKLSETLSTPKYISLAPDARDELITKPKSDKLIQILIDKVNGAETSEEEFVNNNIPAHIESYNKDTVTSQGTPIEPTATAKESNKLTNFILNDDDVEFNNEDTVTSQGTSIEPTASTIESNKLTNFMLNDDDAETYGDAPTKPNTTSPLNNGQLTESLLSPIDISLAPASNRNKSINEQKSVTTDDKRNGVGTSKEELMNTPASIISNNEDKVSSQNIITEPTTSANEPSTSTNFSLNNTNRGSPAYISSDDSEDEDYSPSSPTSSLSECSDSSSSADKNLENEDVQNSAPQVENDANEWQDIIDTVPNFPEHEGNSTINVPLSAKTPTDYYKLFVTEEIINKMVQETNNYAQNYINNNQQNMKPKSRLKAWTPTDSEEMKHFLGVLMVMGLVKVPHINDYWSKKGIYKNEYIISIMRRDRFLLLLKFWHFSNPQGSGKLSKVQDIYLMLLDRFQSILQPGKFLVIDESMVPWRGRLQFRQYIKNKSHKYGVKLYKLCTPEGYTFNLIIYTGKGENGREVDHGQKTVMRLIQDLTHEGRLVITDNFYNSINLAEELILNKTFLCGTLRPNRRGLPKHVISTKLKKGEIVGSMNTKGVRIIKWFDKRPVYMISTCRRHNTTIIDTGKRRKVTGEEIKKPECILTYNDSKKGIDYSDQMSSYYTPLKRGIKWFRKVMMEILFGTALVNSWVVYNWQKENKMSKKDFCESVIEGFTDRPISTSLTVNPRVTKLMKNHTYEKNGDKRRKCVGCYVKLRTNMCSREANKKVKKIKSYCRDCNKPMCLKCFYDSHM